MNILIKLILGVVGISALFIVSPIAGWAAFGLMYIVYADKLKF